MLVLIELEDRTLFDCNLAFPQPLLPLNGMVTGTLASPGETAVFHLCISEPGRLTVRTHSLSGSAFDTRTTLLGPNGQLLGQSDAVSFSNADDWIVQHLQPADDFLRVEGISGQTAIIA